MMEREALLRNILDELADYGKYKGLYPCQGGAEDCPAEFQRYPV